MASKTKTAAKTAKTKRAPAKSAKRVSKTKTTPKRAAVVRLPKRPELSAAAEIATALMLTGRAGGKNAGKTVKRGPVSTQRIGKVADRIGRRKSADVLRDLIYGAGKRAKSETATAAVRLGRKYAGGEITGADMPDGARARLADYASSIGDPKVTKIQSRSLAACLVGLATAKPVKSPAKPKRAAK